MLRVEALINEQRKDMATTTLVLTTIYIASLVLAFCFGGPPAEIVVAIPGILHLVYRWKN